MRLVAGPGGTAARARGGPDRVLVAAGLALGLACLGIAALGDLAAAVRPFVALFAVAGLAYGVAVWRVLRHPPAGRRALAAIVGAGVLFRLLLLPAVPSLSTDLYRYLWDGRLQVAGVSPYRQPPSAPALAAFRDAEVYPKLNHPDWLTIYPPGAQLLFAGVAWLAPGSTLPWKLLVLGCDLATLGLVLAWLRTAGRPPAWGLVYAWHPLVVVELAGNGHLDAVPVLFSVGALWAAARARPGWAGALLGAGGLVKLYPLLLLPVVGRGRPGRTGLVAAGVLAAGYALYAGEGSAVLGSLGRYLREEEFNGTLRLALAALLGGLGPAGETLARGLPLVALGVLAVATGWRGTAWPAPRAARLLVGAYLVTTPNLFPWYAVWLVPILAAAPSLPWLYLTLAVALPYLVFAEPVWRLPPWMPLAEFGPLAVGLGLAAWPGGRAGRLVREPAESPS